MELSEERVRRSRNVQKNVCVNVSGFKKVRNDLTNEGEQNLPPQNMPI